MSLRPVDFAATAVAVLAAVFAAGANARTSDRNQPMDIGADRGTLTMGNNGQTVLTGNVTIRQGSLNIVAAKAVVSQTNGDMNRIVMSGGVNLRQQLDDGSDIDTHATNVDYDLRTEVVVFTGDVEIRQQRGTLNGQRVVYNMKTGQVDGGGAGNGRVKMQFLPKSAQGKPAAVTKPAPASEGKP